MPHFTNIGSLTSEIWRLIDFQDDGRCGAILLPYRTRWRDVLQKINVYQLTKCRQDNSIYGWDVPTFVLQKQRPPYWNSTSGFDLDHLAVICMLFCIRLPNFVQIGTPLAKIWRHIHFSRWRPRPLNATFGFVFVDVAAFRRSKSINKANFVDMSQFTAEI